MISHFRIFGCVFIPDLLRSKFDKKVIRCIFVGYDHERKGWRCCDPSTGRCYTSRNIVFDEASSWWSSQVTTLPNSKEIEEKLEKWIGECSKGEEKELSDEGAPQEESIEGEGHKNKTIIKQKSPWQHRFTWSFSRKKGQANCQAINCCILYASFTHLQLIWLNH